MVIKKTTAKAAAKPAASKASAKPVSTDDVSFEPITVQRTYTEDGQINSDPTETLEHVAFPANARWGRVTVSVGTSAEYGAVKAGVVVSAPYLVEEFDAAKAFATSTAIAILDGLAETVGEDEEPATETKASAKGGKGKAASKEVTSSRKPGKAKAEPEEEEEEEDASDEDDEVTLFEEEELAEMDVDQLKEICEQWDIAWPKAKKENVAKSQAIASILEAQEAAAAEEGDEDEEDAATEEDDEDDGIGPDDIKAMDRKQVEAFIAEYNEEAEEGDELEVDLSEYKKNAAGLKKLQADLIGALFEEEE